MNGRSLIVTTALLAVIFFPSSVRAAGVEVSPVIIDWEGQRRDEFLETISITNNTGRTVTVWPIVADVDPQTGQTRIPDGPGSGHQRFSTWVEVARTDIYLTPGTTKTVDVKVRSSIHAGVGTYHGIIAFPEADRIEDAERRMAGAGKVAITVRVLEDRVEQLNIQRFSALKRVLLAFPAVFDLEVGNGGNAETPIAGTVRFFDRHDKEVGTEVLSGKDLIAPDATIPVAISWSGAGSYGRHKALVELRYGTGSIVTDSTFFYVIPWWALAAFAGAVILAVALVTALMARAHKRHA